MTNPDLFGRLILIFVYGVSLTTLLGVIALWHMDFINDDILPVLLMPIVLGIVFRVADRTVGLVALSIAVLLTLTQTYIVHASDQERFTSSQISRLNQ